MERGGEAGVLRFCGGGFAGAAGADAIDFEDMRERGEAEGAGGVLKRGGTAAGERGQGAADAANHMVVMVAGVPGVGELVEAFAGFENMPAHEADFFKGLHRPVDGDEVGVGAAGAANVVGGERGAGGDEGAQHGVTGAGVAQSGGLEGGEGRREGGGGVVAMMAAAAAGVGGHGAGDGGR